MNAKHKSVPAQFNPPRNPLAPKRRPTLAEKRGPLVKGTDRIQPLLTAGEFCGDLPERRIGYCSFIEQTNEYDENDDPIQNDIKVEYFVKREGGAFVRHSIVYGWASPARSGPYVEEIHYAPGEWEILPYPLMSAHCGAHAGEGVIPRNG
jgi:hypothetical protein